jgi:hypothetical protein
MEHVIGGLTLWSVALGGAFVWDYHHQLRPETPPWARTVRRWRMTGWAACGFAAIWFTLFSGGLSRHRDLQGGRALPAPWWLNRPIVIEVPPPEDRIFHRALFAGSLVVATCTILLNLRPRPGTRTRSAGELRAGSSVAEIPDET